MLTDTKRSNLEETIVMPEVRTLFYERTLEKWLPNKDSSILVVGGGERDKDVLIKLGFTTVTISNLDSRLTGDEFSPYRWSFQRAEQLSFSDGEFDFVIVHEALHHCKSPHAALLEMYRVAKIGSIAFESRDSSLMRILESTGLTQSYEHFAVYYNDCKYGGVDNTEVPNHIYRWTEREIEKTVKSFAPFAYHKFEYTYASDIPFLSTVERKAAFKKIFISSMVPFYKIFSKIFPKQQNLFAFFVGKPSIPEDIHPWLTLRDGDMKFNSDWAKSVYK